MATRPRGTFPPQPPFRSVPDQFFPRYETTKPRVERSVPVPPQTYRPRVEPSYRDPGVDRRKSLPVGRDSTIPRTSDRRVPESRYAERVVERSSTYVSRQAQDVPRARIPERNVGFPVPTDSRQVDSNDNRFKYPTNGWYHPYKDAPPASSHVPQSYAVSGGRDRSFRASRSAFEPQPSPMQASDRYRYDRGADTRGSRADTNSYGPPVNPAIVIETRQLEERVAAIQRELEMLESDNTGSRGSDYRSSRNAYPPTNPPAHPPPLMDLASRGQQREKVNSARFGREEVTLRRREEELKVIEQERMLMRQQRTREQPVVATYGRVAPPRRPERATFPKPRDAHVYATRPATYARHTTRVPERPRLPEKRRATYKISSEREEDKKKRTDEVKQPEKEKRTEKREVKEEHERVDKKKTISGEEEKAKQSQNAATTDALIDRLIGKLEDEVKDDGPPRKCPIVGWTAGRDCLTRRAPILRAKLLMKMFAFCDRKLLTEEVREQAGLGNEDDIPVVGDYKSRTCPLTYNPTTLGALDQFAALGEFKDEVQMDESDEEQSNEVLESLQSFLSIFPRSPAA